MPASTHTIPATFDEAEWKRLSKAKGSKTWKAFILTLLPVEGAGEKQAPEGDDD